VLTTDQQPTLSENADWVRAFLRKRLPEFDRP